MRGQVLLNWDWNCKVKRTVSPSYNVYTDTGPTSLSTELLTISVWPGSPFIAIFFNHRYGSTGKTDSDALTSRSWDVRRNSRPSRLSHTHWVDCSAYRLVGQVVKASDLRAEDPGFESHLRRGFSGSSHTNDLEIGTPVVSLPGAWHYRVSAGTGQPGVNILWLGEVESLICNFYLSVAARTIVWVDPSLRYTI